MFSNTVSLFRGYGSAYTAAAAAAAVYGNLGVGQTASQPQQQASSVFGLVTQFQSDFGFKIWAFAIITTVLDSGTGKIVLFYCSEIRSSTSNPYATYSNSVAASYGYGSQSTNAAASVYAAQAAQAQVSKRCLTVKP